jgi:hypothetical protein
MHGSWWRAYIYAQHLWGQTYTAGHEPNPNSQLLEYLAPPLQHHAVMQTMQLHAARYAVSVPSTPSSAHCCPFVLPLQRALPWGAHRPGPHVRPPAARHPRCCSRTRGVFCCHQCRHCLLLQVGSDAPSCILLTFQLRVRDSQAAGYAAMRCSLSCCVQPVHMCMCRLWVRRV